MNDPDLAVRMAELAERVARLEAAHQRSPEAVLVDSGDVPARGEVRYSGSGPWGDRSVAWQMERAWSDVLSYDLEAPARVLASLASPGRLRIIAALMDGTMSTAELAARVEAATTGQLFHNLKDLLAVGIVHQPSRGRYAIRPQHVLPVLAALSAAMDLAPPGEPG